MIRLRLEVKGTPLTFWTYKISNPFLLATSAPRATDLLTATVEILKRRAREVILIGVLHDVYSFSSLRISQLQVHGLNYFALIAESLLDVSMRELVMLQIR
jgi:hypothetical protein